MVYDYSSNQNAIILSHYYLTVEQFNTAPAQTNSKGILPLEVRRQRVVFTDWQTSSVTRHTEIDFHKSSSVHTLSLNKHQSQTAKLFSRFCYHCCFSDHSCRSLKFIVLNFRLILSVHKSYAYAKNHYIPLQLKRRINQKQTVRFVILIMLNTNYPCT